MIKPTPLPLGRISLDELRDLLAEIGGAQVSITVGQVAGEGYRSRKLDDCTYVFYAEDGSPFLELPVFVNLPIIEPKAPQWPRALSLDPDLSERAN